MSTDKSQITTWRSRLPHTYGTPPANSVDWRRILSSDQNVFDLDTSFEDDSAYDNGSDIAEDIWATVNDSGINIPSDFNFQDIGYDLYAALGGYSVSTLATGVYQHVFSPQNVNTSRQLPAYAMLKKYSGLKTLFLPNMVNVMLSISGAKSGRLKVQSNYKGSGYYEESPSGYSEPALESDRQFAYAQQARFRLSKSSVGTAQVETATIAGSITAPGTVIITVTSNKNRVLAAGKAISVAVLNSDTAAQVAGKVRLALMADPDINFYYVVSGSSATVVLTDRIKSANDTTLNIASTNGTATGLTPAVSSANTTPGVVGEVQNPECSIQSWNVTLNNPEADNGVNVCSDFLTPYDPNTGATRSEYLVGKRDYMFTFEAWLNANDKMRGWMKNRTDLYLIIPIVGVAIPTTNYFYSLTMEHTKARVTVSKETIADPMIGISGSVKLLSSSGSIPLTFTLVNDVASYAS